MVKRPAGLAPRWPDRLATVAANRRRGGRRGRMLRRAVAALLLIGAGVIAVADRQGPAAGIRVVAAARDLPAGASVTSSDLITVALPTVPDGALISTPQVIGRLLSSPVRKGEVLTDVRLVSHAGPDPGPGRVAVPVRPADPATVDLLSPGVHVAVLVVGDDGQVAVLASDAVVLAIPPPSKSEPAKRLVVLAVPSAAADRITASGITGAVALRFT